MAAHTQSARTYKESQSSTHTLYLDIYASITYSTQTAGSEMNLLENGECCVSSCKTGAEQLFMMRCSLHKALHQSSPPLCIYSCAYCITGLLTGFLYMQWLAASAESALSALLCHFYSQSDTFPPVKISAVYLRSIIAIGCGGLIAIHYLVVTGHIVREHGTEGK